MSHLVAEEGSQTSKKPVLTESHFTKKQMEGTGEERKGDFPYLPGGGDGGPIASLIV
jgi:hypothetical protein